MSNTHTNQPTAVLHVNVHGIHAEHFGAEAWVEATAVGGICRRGNVAIDIEASGTKIGLFFENAAEVRDAARYLWAAASAAEAVPRDGNNHFVNVIDYLDTLPDAWDLAGGVGL